MGASDQLARVGPYISRLLDDDYVQEQLAAVVGNLRAGQHRARGKGVKKAGSDKQLRRHLTAAAAASGALMRAMGEPDRPRRHPVRRTIVAAVVGTGAVLAWRELGSGTSVQARG